MAAVRQGAYDYLLKPFEKDQLLATVKRAVDYRRLVQQNAMYRQDLEQLVSARTGMLHQAITDLERSYDITLEALGDALDLKDAETEGHSKRVTAYTIALARGAGIPSQQIPVVARGAFLHDIGKMAIPDAILLKPSKLQTDEQKVMREHCARGYQMLRKIPFLQEAAEIVYSHQEHYDGSGYPRKLKGEQIPLGARIFAVADTLDAITSDRPYRKAATFAAARLEIKRCAGTQFDPKGGGGVSQPARPIVGGSAGGDYPASEEILAPAAGAKNPSCESVPLEAGGQTDEHFDSGDGAGRFAIASRMEARGQGDRPPLPVPRFRCCHGFRQPGGRKGGDGRTPSGH